MIDYSQAIIMGVLQGISELFPVSSLGHSVILPTLLGWNLDQRSGYFLTFLVATHLATALVLFVFYWQEWMRIFQGVLRSIKLREISDTYSKLGWLIIVGTVPAGILGLLFEDKLKILFASPKATAIFLTINGLLLIVWELLRRRSRQSSTSQVDERLSKLSWNRVLVIGLLQALALIPGISRTGSTLGAGLLVGLSHEEAAKFAFLLATPIIAAAAVLKLPELALTNEGSVLGQILVGSLFSAAAAYIAVRFLTKYFKSNTLTPFGIYCLVAGGLATFYLFLR